MCFSIQKIGYFKHAISYIATKIGRVCFPEVEETEEGVKGRGAGLPWLK